MNTAITIVNHDIKPVQQMTEEQSCGLSTTADQIKLIAEQSLGPCPEGYTVGFYDGDINNLSPSNLRHVRVLSKTPISEAGFVIEVLDEDALVREIISIEQTMEKFNLDRLGVLEAVRDQDTRDLHDDPCLRLVADPGKNYKEPRWVKLNGLVIRHSADISSHFEISSHFGVREVVTGERGCYFGEPRFPELFQVPGTDVYINLFYLALATFRSFEGWGESISPDTLSANEVYDVAVL